MLSHLEDLAPGIGKFSLANIWGDLQEKVAKTFAAFYEEPVPEGFYPHFNELSLRRAILMEAPELAQMQQQVQEFIRAGYCALIVDRTGLDSFPNSVRNKLLYALSLSIGFPTPSNQRQGSLLWNVKSRPLPEDHIPTFSEHNYDADLHTDSQSYPTPEEYFILYAVRAARCGGGSSLFCTAEEIKGQLHGIEGGGEILNTLSTFQFPFLISVASAEPGKGAVTLAPILGDRPSIRFRRDVLERGFQARPDLDVPEARRAFAVFLDVLGRKAEVVSHFLDDGAMVVCNNYAMLHGRTSFQDVERHLIRIRMSSQPIALSIANLIQQQHQFAKILAQT